MSWPDGRFSKSIFAVKSLSGSAAFGGSARTLAKDSVVDTSTSISEGRSARDHTTPLSVLTSPDCTPCGTRGRSAARLRYGVAMVPSAAALAVEIKRRREIRRVMEASLEDRHCEEQSDEAIHGAARKAGLLRFARNDDDCGLQSL